MVLKMEGTESETPRIHILKAQGLEPIVDNVRRGYLVAGLHAVNNHEAHGLGHGIGHTAAEQTGC
jgi:hypothetical protein